MIKYSTEPAEKKDILPISRIHASCWREAYSFMPAEVLDNRDVEYRAEQWEAWFGNRSSKEELSKLVTNGTVVGFCFAKENADREARVGEGEMHAAYILPEHRGGVSGPLLMLQMADFLVSKHLCPPVLWAFHKNSMRVAYAHLGWQRFITRDRLIAGHNIPEIGYVHKDVEALRDLLKRIIRRAGT